jgi:hypothetical protein
VLVADKDSVASTAHVKITKNLDQVPKPKLGCSTAAGGETRESKCIFLGQGRDRLPGTGYGRRRASIKISGKKLTSVYATRAPDERGVGEEPRGSAKACAGTTTTNNTRITRKLRNGGICM